MLAGLGVIGASVALGRQTRGVAKRADDEVGLERRLVADLPVLQAEGVDHFRQPRGVSVGHVAQGGGPQHRVDAPGLSLEGLGRGLDGALGHVLSALREGADHLSGGGVDAVALEDGADPLAADPVLNLAMHAHDVFSPFV